MALLDVLESKVSCEYDIAALGVYQATADCL